MFKCLQILCAKYYENVYSPEGRVDRQTGRQTDRQTNKQCQHNNTKEMPKSETQSNTMSNLKTYHVKTDQYYNTCANKTPLYVT